MYLNSNICPINKFGKPRIFGYANHIQGCSAKRRGDEMQDIFIWVRILT
jgi:hypothetical protein